MIKYLSLNRQQNEANSNTEKYDDDTDLVVRRGNIVTFQFTNIEDEAKASSSNQNNKLSKRKSETIEKNCAYTIKLEYDDFELIEKYNPSVINQTKIVFEDVVIRDEDISEPEDQENFKAWMVKLEESSSFNEDDLIELKISIPVTAIVGRYKIFIHQKIDFDHPLDDDDNDDKNNLFPKNTGFFVIFNPSQRSETRILLLA